MIIFPREFTVCFLVCPVLQHYLHEISVLEQSIQKYESHLSREGPLDGVRATNYTKHMLVR